MKAWGQFDKSVLPFDTSFDGRIYAEKIKVLL
jgi:hypothetical protein